MGNFIYSQKFYQKSAEEIPVFDGIQTQTLPLINQRITYYTAATSKCMTEVSQNVTVAGDPIH